MLRKLPSVEVRPDSDLFFLFPILLTFLVLFLTSASSPLYLSNKFSGYVSTFPPPDQLAQELVNFLQYDRLVDTDIVPCSFV